MAADMSLTARVELTQPPNPAAAPPRVGFNVINRWGAKIDWTDAQTTHMHTQLRSVCVCVSVCLCVSV